MKKRACIIIYGRGGHQEQMRRLLERELIQSDDQVEIIAFTDSLHPLTEHVARTYQFKEFRDKYSNWTTLINTPWNLCRLGFVSVYMLMKYSVAGSVTTGPGLGIVPSLIFRLFGKRVVAFETWSKFYEPSIAGRILYRFAGLFFIQNESLKEKYPKALFRGRV